MAAGKTFAKPSPSDSSIEGARRDQKLAATITPPVNPSMPSNHFRCISLKKNTNEAPAAVKAQVNVVATKAALIGPIESSHDTNESNVIFSQLTIVLLTFWTKP